MASGEVRTEPHVDPGSRPGPARRSGGLGPAATPSRRGRQGPGSPTTRPRSAAGAGPFTPRQLSRLDEALTLSSRETGLGFSVWWASWSEPTREHAERLHAGLPHPADGVLLAVSPGQRVLRDRHRRALGPPAAGPRGRAGRAVDARPRSPVGDLVGGWSTGCGCCPTRPAGPRAGCATPLAPPQPPERYRGRVRAAARRPLTVGRGAARPLVGRSAGQARASSRRRPGPGPRSARTTSSRPSATSRRSAGGWPASARPRVGRATVRRRRERREQADRPRSAPARWSAAPRRPAIIVEVARRRTARSARAGRVVEAADAAPRCIAFGSVSSSVGQRATPRPSPRRSARSARAVAACRCPAAVGSRSSSASISASPARADARPAPAASAQRSSVSTARPSGTSGAVEQPAQHRQVARRCGRRRRSVGPRPAGGPLPGSAAAQRARGAVAASCGPAGRRPGRVGVDARARAAAWRVQRLHHADVGLAGRRRRSTSAT